MTNIGELTKDDYYKGYLKLLDQLASIDHINYNTFLAKLDMIFVIEENRVVIANITLLIEPKFIHHNQNVAHLEDFIIDLDYRKNGLGKILLQHCIDVAKDMNCYKLILNCDDKLVSYYQNYNFTNKNNERCLYF
jgi:glucosamine-phosphate N-acetyltransferase